MRNDEYSEWNKNLEKQLKRVEITYEELKKMDKKEIKRKLIEWDTMKWKEEMEEKTTLTLYCKYKIKIQDEKIYDNRLSSTLLFNARTNIVRSK